MNCVHCGKSFRRRSRQVYCSPRCRDVAQAERAKSVSKRHEAIQCKVCGSTYRRIERKAPPGRCANCMHPTGRAHPAYNGGLSFNRAIGRWSIKCRDGSSVYFYRAVMEAHLGRELRPDEQVHHINGDRSDDRIENLELMDIREHAAHHFVGRDAAWRARKKFAWSFEHESCVECGTTEQRHVGHGRCYRCYWRALYWAQKEAAA